MEPLNDKPEMEDSVPRVRRHLLFALSAVALLAMTVWVLLADARREWKGYQRVYREIAEPRGADRAMGIRQVSLPELGREEYAHQAGRVDRCMTCHEGIDRKDLRGDLPQPHRPHPRLDLLVGSGSRHPVSEFGCTICHEGQGSATEFRWASHAPNDLGQRDAWKDRHGWFSNPHWERPMMPARFAEGGCLRCHGAVSDLEASRRRPEPPAPKLLAGYHLVRQFGCYACHEIPGFGEDRQSLGPSLRHVASKVDAGYLCDRLADPARLLSGTRMPRMFGLHEHLEGKSLDEARRMESAEIRAMAEYLLSASEPAEALGGEAPAAVASAERGAELFEVRGCLACHSHRRFPKSHAGQGPDLSQLGVKYAGAPGRRWLDAWLRDPSRLASQTRMPGGMLDPDADTPSGSEPVADVAAFLAAPQATRFPLPDASAVEELASRYLPEGGSRPASKAKRLAELGRAAIARRGCFGCHDIPGFERAQRIGPSLADWGRKSPSLLGFERVDRFVAEQMARSEPTGDEQFFADALGMHPREGFLWQKLRQPRSFDFEVARSKGFGQWLTMGRFAMDDRQREAIMVFILGQVGEVSADRYRAEPKGRQRAIVEGRKVLDKYACAECHTMRHEQCVLRASPGASPVTLHGMTRLNSIGAPAEDEDDEGRPVEFFTLWEPAQWQGRSWAVGEADVTVAKSQLLRRDPPWGGAFARFIFPTVVARSKPVSDTVTEGEPWSRLPPPLVDEGQKVQPAWLMEYLLQPRSIRPTAVLRMPRYRFQSGEAAKLVDYFAAEAARRTAAKEPDGGAIPPAPTSAAPPAKRWVDAMKVLVDRTTFCAKCHLMGNVGPDENIPLAPQLDEIYRRMQPDYVRRWMENPKSILPYTGMPVSFPLTGDPLGQEVFQGSSREQLETVTDLLLHYDSYLKRLTERPASK